METKEDELIFETSAMAGELLLKSGAEISRVEETMQRIAAAYCMKNVNTFVLSNGIFFTAEGIAETYRVRVRHIPLGSARLDRIDAVNALSRKIEQGAYTPMEAKSELIKIAKSPAKPGFHQVMAAGLGSGAFCYLFGGNLLDASAAFVVGFLLYSYILYVVRGRLSKIAANVSGGALVMALSLLFCTLGFGDHLDLVSVGGLLPLIPGVAFTNSIRDFADEDYIAGFVRLIDTLIVIFSIAIGVGLVMMWCGMGKAL
jgi:uncharacterized membrane protein YjjP (DUF1212 family)